jgi:hypothetical protein
MGALASYPHPPEACLVNFYGCHAKMGLHQDRDEAELAAPVVSISLGDSCCFRYGGSRRGDPTKKLELRSGDILVMGGAADISRRGQDFSGLLLAAAGRRANQPDLAAGGAAGRRAGGVRELTRSLECD